MTDRQDDSSEPLVGLVVVSHSRALARAAVSLAEEMVHDRPVRIAVAAGLDDLTLGTDAVRIKEAIAEVDGPEGVVVLMDLGSAVLSTELALDLLEDPAVRDRVLLSAAPLVEGLIVAAVAAAGGASRAEVAAEACGALMGKAAHLGGPADAAPSPAGEEERADLVATFTVTNRHGLHARPAARLVSELRGLDARVQLRNLTTGTGPVPASSLSRVATLAALHGHDVEILASGPQAREATDHLLALAARHFDEPLETAPAPVVSPRSGPLPRVARHRYRPGPPAVPRRRGRPRPGRRARRGMAPHRRSHGRRQARDRANQSRRRPGSRTAGGADLRCQPDVARRHRSARRRQAAGQRRSRRGDGLGASPGGGREAMVGTA